MKKILSVHLLIIIAVFLIHGCKKGSTEPPSERSFTSDAYGNIALTNQHVMVVRNPLGSILIIGQGSSNSCRWYLNKTIETQLASDTASIFSSIRLLTQTTNDTLIIEINSSSQSNPKCLVQLSIPYSIICHIDQVSGDIEVDDMDSSLTIENASNVNVVRHNGSCQIFSGSGNVSVECAVPIGSSCLVNVKKGDITLKIPTIVSAQVYAKSDNGTVSQTGLTFTSVQQQSNLLNGKLGSGHGSIQLETTQGNIHIQGSGNQISSTSSAIVEGKVIYLQEAATPEESIPAGFKLVDCMWVTTRSDSVRSIYLSGKVDSSYLNKNARAYGTIDTIVALGWSLGKYLDLKADTIIVLY